MKDKYKVIYGMGDTPDMEQYFNEKGFRTDVYVEIGENTFEAYFFLSSTLEYEMTLDGYCSYPGLIILEDITSKQIELAIEKLYELGFFNYLKPLKPDQKRFWHKIHYTPGKDNILD